MDKQELQRVEAYLRRTLANAAIRVQPLMRKKDTAEVFVGTESLGVLTLDEEDGERSYHLSIAILDVDLEEA